MIFFSNCLHLIYTMQKQHCRNENDEGSRFKRKKRMVKIKSTAARLDLILILLFGTSGCFFSSPPPVFSFVYHAMWVFPPLWLFVLHLGIECLFLSLQQTIIDGFHQKTSFHAGFSLLFYYFILFSSNGDWSEKCCAYKQMWKWTSSLTISYYSGNSSGFCCGWFSY